MSQNKPLIIITKWERDLLKLVSGNHNVQGTITFSCKFITYITYFTTERHHRINESTQIFALGARQRKVTLLS